MLRIFSTLDLGAGSMASVGGFEQQIQDIEPRSNMVLRKRIRRIRQGMKKYNDQLVEVKRELKGCKTKMEAQTKQVHEYSSRLEEYDKKFEENSRKFQTLLTVSTHIFIFVTNVDISIHFDKVMKLSSSSCITYSNL